ncbi:non-ribosomal peptide synthetase [Nocardia nova SH22a]|uniref:Non-ribosomal peptide synthetase n=1 Tax=Nocardia nova SH22a TaxID=1415166 RepID=W5TGU5_9NOCA|nr:amino acid adenylation domain-containing protein [Nocardia nova]AHH18364.1 non-ribosomal peptide synthetase [Nocardia nova SH22a]
MNESGSATDQSRRLELVRRRMAQRRIGIENSNSAAPPLDEPVALNPAQRGLWLHQQRRPRSCAYNVTFVCTIDGAVDAGRLHDAVRACCDRQLLTRTLYEPADDGTPRQRVDSGTRAEVTVVDCRGNVEAAFAELADRHAGELSARPFDLATESALRVRLLAAAERCAMIVSVHHIMWDGPSLGSFFEQIAREYRGFPADVHAQLRDLVVRESRRHNARREQSLRYWMDTLRSSGTLATPQLYAVRDGERPEAATTFTVELGPDACAHLKDLCDPAGATEFAVFTAALEIALSAHADTDSTGLATMMSWRTAPGSDGLWADLGHTVRLRRHLAAQDTFADVVERVVTEIAAATDHLDITTDEIDAAARDRADVDTQITGLVLYQHYAGGIDLPGTESEWAISAPSDVAYPFAVQGVRYSDVLRVYCTFQRHVIDETDMRAVIGHLAELLSTASATATVEQLRRSNAVTARQPVSRPGEVGTVLDLLEPTLVRSAGTAIIDGERRIGYPELDTRSADLAGTLRSHGVLAEDVVAVLLPRSAGLAVALLAILRAGGAYIFVPVDLPEQRVREILDATEPRVVLTAPGAIPPASGSAVVEVDRDGAHEKSGTPIRAPRRNPLQRAAIYYTSGSTGQAKAVDMTDAALAARVRWGAAHWPVRADRPRLAKSKMSFIDGATEILEGLASGGTVAIADDGTCRDVQRLARFAHEHRARHMMAVPTLLRALLELEQFEFDSVVSTGEPLSAELVAALHRTHPALTMENSYGCTETAGDVTVGIAAATGRRPAVGTAPAGTAVVVLNRRLQPVRPGALGEVYVRGPQVVRGYLADSGNTSIRFVADPYDPGGRMYRTGDIGRVRPDGALELIGRIDSQVKVRGQRVDTGEVAATMQGVVGAEATVAVIADIREDSTDLIGYFATDTPVDERSVRRALSAALPPYMVPARVLRIDRIPLLPSGKVDRAALLRDARDRTEARAADADGPDEQALLGVARQLTGRPDLGVTDNLFEFGIDSIRAVSLVRRARTDAALGFDVDDVFLEPTVRGLSRLATKERTGDRARDQGSLALPWPAALLRPTGVDARDAVTYAAMRWPHGVTPDDMGRRLSQVLRTERFEHLQRRFMIRGRLWRTYRNETPPVIGVVPVIDPGDGPWMAAGIDLTRGQTTSAARVPARDGELLVIAGSALVATGPDLTALAQAVCGDDYLPGTLDRSERPVEHLPATGDLPSAQETARRTDRLSITVRLPGPIPVADAIAALFDVLAMQFGIDTFHLDLGLPGGIVPLRRGHTPDEIGELRDERTAAAYRAQWPAGASDRPAVLFQERTAPPVLSPHDAHPFHRPASGAERVYPLTAQHYSAGEQVLLGVAADPLIGYSAVAVSAAWSARLRDSAGRTTTSEQTDISMKGQLGA